MRMRGVLKLLLNTPVFPTTRYEMVGQKSVRFVGVDAEAQDGTKSEEVSFSAFRLNLHSSDQQGKFLAVLRDAADGAKD
ncbi:YRB2 [Symbiodinium natans]|uniref:YRB2 protein n=1 Tax=Symbiodinium natans TaxID=878477 RepID=A0A812RP19_9DINO|nr:YRB2 [Symbiodinium natans]